MFVENRTAKAIMIAVLVLLVIPLLVILGMMAFGSGMMAQMGMSGGAMALCILWSVLVAMALIFLIFLLVRGPGRRATD